MLDTRKIIFKKLETHALHTIMGAPQINFKPEQTGHLYPNYIKRSFQVF
jgi:hypothetical protein